MSTPKNTPQSLSAAPHHRDEVTKLPPSSADPHVDGAVALRTRQDFQEAVRIPEKIITAKAQPHDVKIAGYRDRVMALLVI